MEILMCLEVCMHCHARFGVMQLRRKHHCRRCGKAGIRSPLVLSPCLEGQQNYWRILEDCWSRKETLRKRNHFNRPKVVCNSCSRSREVVAEYHPVQPQRVCAFACHNNTMKSGTEQYRFVVKQKLLALYVVALTATGDRKWKVCNSCVASPAVPENPEEASGSDRAVNRCQQQSTCFRLEATKAALEAMKAGKYVRPLSLQLSLVCQI